MARSHGKPSGRKVIADNRKARHDYEILERFEAGLALLGTEVKSLREGRCTLREAYVVFRGGNAVITGMHIPEYSHGNINNHDPLRDRQLLLHRQEIDRLRGLVDRKGLTIVPLTLYFVGGRVKLEIGTARGRKAHDRREAIKRRDQDRDVQRALRDRMR